jgi:hypothetical protein
MRYLAATLFGLAAFAVPVPFVDRAGVALLGLAAIALAVASRPRVLERVEPRPMPPAIFGLDDELEEELAVGARRVQDYLNGSAARP